MDRDNSACKVPARTPQDLSCNPQTYVKMLGVVLSPQHWRNGDEITLASHPSLPVSSGTTSNSVDEKAREASPTPATGRDTVLVVLVLYQAGAHDSPLFTLA